VRSRLCPALSGDRIGFSFAGWYLSAVTKQNRELRDLAERHFGWSRLCADQVRAMEHVMAGHDVLAVLPTGAFAWLTAHCRLDRGLRELPPRSTPSRGPATRQRAQIRFSRRARLYV
jgi:hypothetical protein